MRENKNAPGVELRLFGQNLSSKREEDSFIMKRGHCFSEKASAWRSHAGNNSMALDRLVEVALSPTGVLDHPSRSLNHAQTSGNQVRISVDTETSESARDGDRDGARAGFGDVVGEESAPPEKRRQCSTNSSKVIELASTPPSITPSPSSLSPSPCFEAHHHRSSSYFQQQQQQQHNHHHQKLKRRVSSFNEISTPPPTRRSSSSFRVHLEHRHPHVKRFKMTPRFKALVDISC